MNHARVHFPYLGMNEQGETTRNWVTMRFTSKQGPVDRRRIKREIRKWGKRALGRSIHPTELIQICRKVEHS